MKKHIGTLMILVGIAVIALPLIGRYMAAQKQKELMDAFLEEASTPVNQSSYEDVGEALTWGANEDNQGDLIEGATETPSLIDDLEDGESTQGNLDDAESIKAKPKAIAIMEIPKIDVYLPVAEGADLATLKFALGHMPETSPLGAIGNAVVAGHRSHSFGLYFNRLDEVTIGDEIYVTVGGKKYTYEVYETLIVEPTDLSVLRSSSKYRVLTLVTCHPLYTSTHRLIVHAVVKE